MAKTAILVDGGFYRKRAELLWGPKSPMDRASELRSYCRAHINTRDGDLSRQLYRIFYYDCPPINKKIFHPLHNRTIDFGKTELFSWAEEFLNQLKRQRKFALRMGRLSEPTACYALRSDTVKSLFKGTKIITDLEDNDFSLSIEQKGVDMKIGLDIASLAYKKQVDQIILISGDSDFVPAAKLARREGIDFILDPMWATIKPDLFEHIDGLRSPWKKGEQNHQNDKCEED
jgi:uncharacterized LabA/DUF88 family protein